MESLGFARKANGDISLNSLLFCWFSIEVFEISSIGNAKYPEDLLLIFMKPKTVFWVVIGLVAEKILQHGLTALLFVVNIDGIGKPDVGNLILLSDPVMAVLNFIVMGLFIWGFWDIWKSGIIGLYLVIGLSLFDIIAEFVFHGVGFVTVSVVVAIVLIGFALALKSIGKNGYVSDILLMK